MGSIITRAVLLVAGYVYPAYECFKNIEKPPLPEVDVLSFWCQYWIIMALLTVFERVGDTFVSWMPFYNEAKLAFVIYLWYPKTKGTIYVYTTFLKPFVVKHEPDIDQNLSQIKERASGLAVAYTKQGMVYVHKLFFELLQNPALQSQDGTRTGWIRRSFTAGSNYGTTTAVSTFTAVAEPPKPQPINEKNE